MQRYRSVNGCRTSSGTILLFELTVSCRWLNPASSRLEAGKQIDSSVSLVKSRLSERILRVTRAAAAVYPSVAGFRDFVNFNRDYLATHK